MGFLVFGDSLLAVLWCQCLAILFFAGLDCRTGTLARHVREIDDQAWPSYVFSIGVPHVIQKPRGDRSLGQRSHVGTA